MSVLLEAADAVEREAARAESLAAVARDLRKVGSMQQAADEAEARLAQSQADHHARLDGYAVIEGAASARIAEINQRIDGAKVALTQAEGETARLIQRKTAEAEKIVREANDQADEIVRSARSNAEAIEDDAEKKARALQPAIDAGQAKLDGLEAEIATAQAQLADAERARVAAIEKLSR